MKLTIFNCSPKHGINNTDVLLGRFIEGFKIQSGNEAYIYKLNKLDSMEEAVQIFSEAEAVMIAFPLYCYSMPGGVKQFIEKLEPLCGKCEGKKLAFLVQYGFREAVHARPLEKYLIKLAKTLDCDYMSTIIKGGCDGLSMGKGVNNEEILSGIVDIGETLGKTGALNQSQIDEYSMPEVEEKQSIPIMKKILEQINEHYWGAMLRKNGVTLEESYAKPYEVLD